MHTKYGKDEQKLMAGWAAECVARVLPLFEKVYPGDDRPRKAIDIGRAFALGAVFTMAEMRGAAFAAHSAARDAKENSAACFAARAAGQAVATAHVPEHCFYSIYYALKAVAAVDPEHAVINVAKEWAWELSMLPETLKADVLQRVNIQNKANKVTVKIRKDEV
jgi:hypothetical protein